MILPQNISLAFVGLQLNPGRLRVLCFISSPVFVSSIRNIGCRQTLLSNIGRTDTVLLPGIPEQIASLCERDRALFHDVEALSRQM